MKLQQAQIIAQRAINMLIEAGAKEELLAVGSVRREMNYCTDIDLAGKQDHSLITATERLIESGEIQKALFGYRGESRWDQSRRAFLLKDSEVTFELFMFDQHNRGYIMWLRTGPSKGGEYIMRSLHYRNAPFRFDEGYGWTLDGKRLSIPDENALFSLLGLPYIPPRNRSDSLYEMYFKRPSHTWGDPAPHVIPEPSQPALF